MRHTSPTGPPPSRVIALLVAVAILLPGASAGARKKENDQRRTLKALRAGWLYSKPLDCDEDRNTYKQFQLDEEIYRFATPDLRDLRIADENGNIAPSFIKDAASGYRAEEIRYPAIRTGHRTDPAEKTSTWEFRIIAGGRRTAAERLILDVPQRIFTARITVFGGRGDGEWEELAAGCIYRLDTVTKTDIALTDEPDFQYYRFVVSAAKPAITIRSVVLAGSEYPRAGRLYKQEDLSFDIVKEGNGSTLVTIHNPDRLRIFRLVLDADGPFNRSYTLYAPAGPAVRPVRRAQPVQRGTLYTYAHDGITVSDLSIDLAADPLRAPRIYLRIHNRGEEPREIDGVAACYFIDRVVFASTNGTRYRLYFGNRRAHRLTFDIGNYRQHIDMENQDACVPGDLANNTSRDGGIMPVRTQKLLFNIAALLLSIIVIVFLVRKLAEQE